MKILFLTADGEMLGLAERIAVSHEVKVFVAGGTISQLAGAGRVPRVLSWRPEMSWADLVVADYELSPAEQNILRDRGRLLFGVGTVNLEELITASPQQGLPFSLVGFWNGHGWIEPMFYATGQHYQLTGDLGPRVESFMSTNVWPIEKVMPGILPVADKLTQSNYRGPIHFEMVLSEDKTEISNVIAHPQMMLLAPILELISDDPVEFLTAIASGGQSIFGYHKQVAVAQRLYAPPWPYQMDAMIADPIDIDEKVKHNLWLIDVVKQTLEVDEEISHLFFGASGSFSIATAIGRKGSRPKDYFREAHRRLAKVVSGIHHPFLQYRNDVSDQVRENHKQLRSQGIE